MQLTARQGGFEHIARIHCAFGLACADHGVQLVDKNNGLAFVFGQLAQHGFETLFKLTAKLRTRQQRRHIQRQDTFAFKRVRHLASHDTLRQTFDDGGFTDTRLTDQDWVVFATALQNLNRATNLVVATNHRI